MRVQRMRFIEEQAFAFSGGLTCSKQTFCRASEEPVSLIMRILPEAETIRSLLVYLAQAPASHGDGRGPRQQWRYLA